MNRPTQNLPGAKVPNEMTLRLLADWLLHCHERARQRKQLGVLALEPCDTPPS